MTEVEFSHLLSALTETANQLNRDSDTINGLIERFETKLREINLGIEVWLPDGSLASTPWTEDDEQGRTVDEGTHDTELGFAKLGQHWVLATRRATYRRDGGDWSLLETNRPVRLLDGSRDLRIKALSLFPKLAAEMKNEGERAIGAIQEAKKFVK